MNRLPPRGDDTGMTLAELLVAMTITVVFFAVFSSIAVKLFDSSTNQQARSDNLDGARQVVQVLDRQVRYANAINEPLVYNSAQYVTWRSGSINGSGQPNGTGLQTCYQWRVTAIGLMQYRSWDLPYVSAGSWHSVATGVGGSGIFSISVAAGAVQQSREQLTVSFTSSHGTKPVGTPTTVAFTALNTRTSSAPAAPVCQEVSPS